MSSLKSYLAKLEACLSSLPSSTRLAMIEELRVHLEEHAAALRAEGLEKEASMGEAIERFGEAREIGAALRDVHGRGSWGEALAAVVPFLAFGLTTVLYEILPSPDPVWPWGFVACYVVLLVGLGVGWVKGFPRWSYPYGGLVLVLTWWWMGIPGQDLWAYKVWILKGYNGLLGWWAWIPFLLMAVITLLLTRSVRPLRQLLMGVWRDWTRLSFGLYGVMPILVWMNLDEVSASYAVPCEIVSTILLAAGTVSYVRSARMSQRALALLTGMTLSWALATVAPAIFYADVVWKPWKSPVHPQVAVRGVWHAYGRGGVIVWSVLTVVMFAPALLSLLRKRVESVWAR